MIRRPTRRHSTFGLTKKPTPSGRSFRRFPRDCTAATGSRACSYRTGQGHPVWLNRDPIFERGGINLYQYVRNRPIGYIDPLGFEDSMMFGAADDHAGRCQFADGATQAASAFGQTAASIFIEPYDWALTLGEILKDPENPWSYAGALPIVPSPLVKALRNAIGKGNNFMVRTQRQAEALIEQARPNIPWRPTYEAPKPSVGKEIHPPDGSGVDLPHIKWRDWAGGKCEGADGHIYFENLNP